MCRETFCTAVIECDDLFRLKSTKEHCVSSLLSILGNLTLTLRGSYETKAS